MSEPTATDAPIVANGVATVETRTLLSDAMEDWAQFLEGEVKIRRKNGVASAATRAIYLQGARRFVNFATEAGMPPHVEGITREHVEAFLVSLADRKPATADTYRRAVGRWFAWLVEDEVLKPEDDPTRNVKAIAIPETPPPVLKPEDVRAILEVCKGRDFESRRDTAIIWLLLCGLRRGEVAGLKFAAVQRRDGEVTVTGKGNRTRSVPFMSPEVGNALRRYEHVRKTHHARALDTYFVGWKGRLSGDGIRQAVERRAEQAGVKGVYAHLFRHTFAHMSKAAGMTDEDIMSIGGWRNHASLLRYGASARSERAKAAAARFDIYGDV